MYRNKGLLVMYIMPINNYQPSYRGKFLKTRALSNYVDSLDETGLKLFLRNKQLMEAKQDGKIFIYEKKYLSQNAGGQTRVVLRENNWPIINEVTHEWCCNVDGEEVSKSYPDAEKKVFDKLFDKYNNDRKFEETQEYNTVNKRINKLKDRILSEIEPINYGLGKIRTNLILSGDKYVTVDAGQNRKRVYSKSKELLQEYTVFDKPRNENYGDYVLKDYENGKLVREYICNSDYTKVNRIRITENGAPGPWRCIYEDGSIGEPV